MGLSTSAALIGIAETIFVTNFNVNFLQAQQRAPLVWPQEEFQEKEEPIEPQSPDLDPRGQVVALYDEFRPRLFRYIHGMGIGRDQVEEVIQETFLRLTDHLLNGETIENLHGWVVRVAQNLASDIRRKNFQRWKDTAEDEEKLGAEQVDPAPTPEDAYLRVEQIKRIKEALQSVRLLHRQCFELRMQGFRYEDIGEALGISKQHAAVLVNRVAVRLAAICE